MPGHFEREALWMAIIPGGLLVVGLAFSLIFLEPVLGVALVALAAFSICDIYFDVLYRRLGTLVLRSLSGGRFPPPVPSRSQTLLVSLVGFGVVLALLTALLFFVSI